MGARYYFATGLMAGIIAVLSVALLFQPGTAWARQGVPGGIPGQPTPVPNPGDPAGGGSSGGGGRPKPAYNQDGGTGSRLIAIPGGTGNSYDMLWVLTTRPARASEPAHAKLAGGEKTTLCLYKAGQRGFDLIGIRDVSFDLELYERFTSPPIQDITNEVNKMRKKEEEQVKDGPKKGN